MIVRGRVLILALTGSNNDFNELITIYSRSDYSQLQSIIKRCLCGSSQYSDVELRGICSGELSYDHHLNRCSRPSCITRTTYMAKSISSLEAIAASVQHLLRQCEGLLEEVNYHAVE